MAAAGLTVGVSLLALGCREPVRAFGETPAAAARNADDLLSGLALRFGPRVRDERLRVVRPRLIRHSLSPSRIHDDTSMWSRIDGQTRTLAVGGDLVGDRYELRMLERVPIPVQPGEARHVMNLRRLDDGAYEWKAIDQLAVGGISAAGLPDLFAAMLRTFERRSPGTVRAGYRAALPRGSAAFGRMFTIDSLRTAAAGDGSTHLHLRLKLRPEMLAPSYPELAEYLDKWLSPMRWRMTLADADGATWLAASGDDGEISVELRSRDGALLPLDAAARPMPERLTVTLDFRTKVMIFTVGATQLVGEVVLLRDPGTWGFTTRFQSEPRWRLPLATEQIIGGSLRRPFEGEGATMTYAARDGAQGQTLLEREIHLVVRESALVRWLGGLGSRAFDDVTAAVEREAHAFFGESLAAVRADVLALLSGHRNAVATEVSAGTR